MVQYLQCCLCMSLNHRRAFCHVELKVKSLGLEDCKLELDLQYESLLRVS